MLSPSDRLESCSIERNRAIANAGHGAGCPGAVKRHVALAPGFEAARLQCVEEAVLAAQDEPRCPRFWQMNLVSRGDARIYLNFLEVPMLTRPFKQVIPAVSLLVLAVTAYWYWSPLLALHQMQSAAKARDGASFNERVDYPRLRESLKSSLLGHDAEQPASDSRAGSMGRAIGEALVGRLIDGLVQPQVVMRMMEQGKLKPTRPESTTNDRTQEKDVISERVGTNTFIAYVGQPGESKEQRLALVMERSGFATWRLVGLKAPAQGSGFRL